MSYTWNELFWIFFSYSFIGWCAGVIAFLIIWITSLNPG